MSENATPLEALRAKLLRSRPPSIGALLSFLSNAEDYLWFASVVRELLPERESEILSHALPSEQIREFVSHFQTRYFPLEESFLWDMEEYGYVDFLRIIPVQVYGMTYEGYHDEMQDFRPGMQLMTYLFRNPWDEEDDGARVALAEICVEHVPQETLSAVPEGGIDLDDAERIFKGTRYDGVWRWGQYLFQDTSNFFLDTDYEYLWSGYGAIDWHKDTVEELTQQWLQQEELCRQHIRIFEWIEEDPANRFKEIVDFVNKSIKKPANKRERR